MTTLRAQVAAAIRPHLPAPAADATAITDTLLAVVAQWIRENPCAACGRREDCEELADQIAGVANRPATETPSQLLRQQALQLVADMRTFLRERVPSPPGPFDFGWTDTTPIEQRKADVAARSEMERHLEALERSDFQEAFAARVLEVSVALDASGVLEPGQARLWQKNVEWGSWIHDVITQMEVAANRL